jgi:protein-S-isoprenylcysteine O-methyltransferase Ste14
VLEHGRRPDAVGKSVALCISMASPLPRSLQHHIDKAADPTSIPASVLVAAVLVVVLLVVFSMAIEWSVDGIGRTQVATAQQ